MKKSIINGILFSLSAIFTLIISLVCYGAWINITTKNNGDLIDSTEWNKIINNLNYLNTTISGISSTPSGTITGGCNMGIANGTATNCSVLQAYPYMSCATGNTPLVFTFCKNDGSLCARNSNFYPMGICVKN